jgi:protein-S-isoprenylcysteine O-methyltransferase Ste14
MNNLFARAVLAFLALPGVVAFVIPLWLLRRSGNATSRAGLVILALGTLILLSCVRDFYVAGKGTLAPWSPPRHLVTRGLYRFSRNPMYVGVIVILIGWAVMFQSRGHATYAAIMMVVFYLRVVLFEEPWLARTHGDAWQVYRARVPRRFVW